MKRKLLSPIFVMFLALWMPPSHADESSMVPISELLNDQSPEMAGTVILRCFSLFKLGADSMKGTNADSQSASRQNIADRMLYKWLLIAPRIGFKETSEQTQYVSNQAQIMINAYLKKFESGRALRGNMFGDPVVSSDLKICSALNKLEN